MCQKLRRIRLTFSYRIDLRSNLTCAKNTINCSFQMCIAPTLYFYSLYRSSTIQVFIFCLRPASLIELKILKSYWNSSYAASQSHDLANAAFFNPQNSKTTIVSSFYRTFKYSIDLTLSLCIQM